MNEEKKKNNTGLIIVIVILIILVLALCGYIAYDKLVVDKKEAKEVKTEDVVKDDEKETTNVLSDEEALKIGNELWKYAYSTYWGEESVWKRHEGEVNEAGGRPIVCDTTAGEVKKKYSSDFKYIGETGEKGGIDDFVIDCFGAQRGGNQMYKTTTLAINTIEESKIVFDAKSEYCGSSFCQESKDTEKSDIMDFIITKENDEWLINRFYLPN